MAAAQKEEVKKLAEKQKDAGKEKKMWKIQSTLLSLDLTQLHEDVKKKLSDKDEEVAHVLGNIAKLQQQLTKADDRFRAREIEFEAQIVAREQGYDLLLGDIELEREKIKDEQAISAG